ncbi:MAG: hypothetical protein HY297_01725, partial [Thaumarchaeota archaeon]|nr:hypothetical protein [Nitrososphaerota archaeon]
MYAQLLIAASFITASYQDVKERSVSDLVWVPALAGVALVFVTLAWRGDFSGGELQLLKLGLIGGIALAFAFIGSIGQADAIAMAFVASDPYAVSPILPLFGAAAVALGHIAYLFAMGIARGVVTVPMDKFLREQRWIPKAIVSDGVRTEVSRDVNVARDEVEASRKGDA